MRHYLGLLREGDLLDKLRSSLEPVHVHGFRVLSLEPRHKDGGVFVHFQYLNDDSNRALDDILTQARHIFAEQNGSPSWMGSRYAGNAWLVKGKPWREVRHRLIEWLVQTRMLVRTWIASLPRYSKSLMKVQMSMSSLYFKRFV